MPDDRPAHEVQVDDLILFNVWRLTWLLQQSYTSPDSVPKPAQSHLKRRREDKWAALQAEIEASDSQSKPIDEPTLRKYMRGQVNPLGWRSHHLTPTSHHETLLARLLQLPDTPADGVDPWALTGAPVLFLWADVRDADFSDFQRLARSLVAKGCEVWLDAWETADGPGFQRRRNEFAERAWVVLACVGALSPGSAPAAIHVAHRGRRGRPTPVVEVHRRAETRLSCALPLAASGQKPFLLQHAGRAEDLPGLLFALRIVGKDRASKLGELTPERMQFAPPQPAAAPHGFAAFSPEHARAYCGRESELEALVVRLECGEERPGVVVLGESGVGKSSFVQAALLPRMQLVEWGHGHTCRLISVDCSPIGLEHARDALLEARRQRVGLVVSIDDLRTSPSDSKLAELFEELAVHIDQGLRLRIVVTLRSDRLSSCERYLKDRGALRIWQALDLHRLRPAKSHEVVEWLRVSARMRGVELSRDLLADVAERANQEPWVLPAIAVRFHELVRSTGPGSTIWLGELRGGENESTALVDAVSRHCDSVAPISSPAKSAMLRLLFDLVDERGVSGFGRRARPRRLLLAYSAEDVHRLESGALLVPDRHDPHMVCLAHDALLVHWNRFAFELTRAASLLAARDAFCQLAAAWHGHGKDRRFLAGVSTITVFVEQFECDRPSCSTADEAEKLGPSSLVRRLWVRLARYRTAWGRRPSRDKLRVILSDREWAFLTTSIEAHARKRLRLLGLGMALVVGGVVGYYGKQQPCEEFPAFGACVRDDSVIPLSADLHQEAHRCVQGRCAPGIAASRSLRTKLPKSGQRWAVLELKKPWVAAPWLDPELHNDRPLSLRLSNRGTRPTRIEVKVVTHDSAVGYFHCHLPARATVERQLRVADLGAVHGFQLSQIHEFSLGFSRDAGTPGGEQSIELLGVGQWPARVGLPLDVAPCRPRGECVYVHEPLSEWTER